MTLLEYVRKAGSVAEAARQLDVPYNTLARWLKGQTTPSRAMRRLLREKEIETASI